MDNNFKSTYRALTRFRVSCMETHLRSHWTDSRAPSEAQKRRDLCAKFREVAWEYNGELPCIGGVQLHDRTVNYKAITLVLNGITRRR
jgi:hypothetical protein